MKPQPLDLEEFRWDGSEFGEEYHSYPTEAEREIVYAVVDIAVKFHNGDIDKIKQRFKSACEFWLRYKDNPKLFIREHPEYLEKVRRLQREWYNWEEHYNKWLFKLAFRGVME